MADKAKKEKKEGFFKRMWHRLVKSFKDTKGEIKKVVWPSKKQVINNTAVVLVSCLLVGAFIWLLDGALSGLVNLLLRSAG